MMQTSTTESILRALVGAYVTHPEDLQIATHAKVDGSQLWTLKGHLEDEGMLVGSRGSHVDALDFLVRQFGEAEGKRWSFLLVTRPKVGGPRPHEQHRDDFKHDPRPSQDLLTQIVAEVVAGAFDVAVTRSMDPELTFSFAIRVRDPEDFARLVKPARAGGPSIITALGTLFRAIAKKKQVRYQLDVVEGWNKAP